MKGEGAKTSVRPGEPMSEEELKEWKKSFSDIQESIDALYAEDRETSNNCRDLFYNSNGQEV